MTSSMNLRWNDWRGDDVAHGGVLVKKYGIDGVVGQVAEHVGEGFGLSKHKTSNLSTTIIRTVHQINLIPFRLPRFRIRPLEKVSAQPTGRIFKIDK